MDLVIVDTDNQITLHRDGCPNATHGVPVDTICACVLHHHDTP